MSVVAAVLEKIRGKRVETVKSLYTQYHELVSQLASGTQVDADELAIVLDALDKSNADLENDVERLIEREPKKSELMRLRQVRDSIPGLTAERDALGRKLDDAIAKLRPKIDELNEQLRSAETQSLQIHSLEARLLETAKDPTLTELQNRVVSQRSVVAAKLRDLEPELMSARSRLSFFESQVQSLGIERSRLGPSDISGHATHSEKVTAAKQSVKTWERTVEQLAATCGELRREVAGYDRELKTIYEKLIAS